MIEEERESARGQLGSDTPAALAAVVSEQGTGLEELVEALRAALEASVLGGAKKAAPSS